MIDGRQTTQRKRIFVATLWAGCLDNSSIPLSEPDFDYADFSDLRSVDPHSLQARWLPQYSILTRANDCGWEVYSSICATSNPGYSINSEFFASLFERLKSDYLENGPFDAVVLVTSGITRTFDNENVEDYLLDFLNEHSAERTRIGYFTNCHSDVPENTIDKTDIFYCLKEYPHTDWGATSAEMFETIRYCVENDVQTGHSIYRPQILGVIITKTEGYKKIHSYISELLHSHDEIVHVSLLHGNAGINSPDNEVKIIITGKRDNRELHDLIFEKLSSMLFAISCELIPPIKSISTILAFDFGKEKTPVILADFMDNPFGGAPGDSMALVHELISFTQGKILIGPVYDPGSVMIARSAGIGATLMFRVGAKISCVSGQPFDGEFKVIACADNVVQRQPSETGELCFPTGNCVYLSNERVHIVVSNRRQQTFDPRLFTQFGIDLHEFDFVIVKSKKEYEALFSNFAKFSFPVAPGTNGSETVDWFKLYDFSKIRRPIWPLDDVKALANNKKGQGGLS